MESKIINRIKQLEQVIELSGLSQKEVLTFSEFCKYCGISESYGYKLTSQNKVPHYKPSGKMVYFKQSEVNHWLLSNQVKSVNQVESEVDDYLACRKPGV